MHSQWWVFCETPAWSPSSPRLLLLRLSCGWILLSFTQSPNVGGLQNSTSFCMCSQSLDDSSISITLWVLIEANTEISIPISPGIQTSLTLSIWLSYWWLIIITNSTCPSQEGEPFMIQVRSCHPSAPTLYQHPISCSIQPKFSPWAYSLLPLQSHLLLFCPLPTLLMTNPPCWT